MGEGGEGRGRQAGVKAEEKPYREEINNKIKSNTQPAKNRAKSGLRERSWSY